VKLLAPVADDLAEWKAMAEPIGLVFPTAKGRAMDDLRLEELDAPGLASRS
jgi:hypothetical protein